MTFLLCTLCDQDIQPGESYGAADLGDDAGYRYAHQPACPATAPPPDRGSNDSNDSNGRDGRDGAAPAHRPSAGPVPDVVRQAVQPSPTAARRRRGLHDSVVHELGRMIVCADPVTNGPLLPDAVCERFDISRTVQREAFRCLQDKGMISARPNAGTHVRPVGDWNLLDPDIIEWRALGPRAAEQQRDLRELRWMTETTAVRLAGRHPRTAATDSIALSLHATVRGMTWAVHNGQKEDFARADTEFHELLVEAGGNSMLRCLHQIVSQGLVHGCTPGWCLPDASVCAHHQTVADAIDEGSDGAEQAIRELLAEAAHAGRGVVP